MYDDKLKNSYLSLKSEFAVTGSARVRQYVADILYTGHKHDESLTAHTTAGMRY